MFSFIKVVEAIGDLVQRPITTDTNYRDKIKVWVNFDHSLLGNIYDWWNSLRERYEWTTENGKERYFLPSNFDKPLSKVFDKTNYKELDWKTENEYMKERLSVLTETGKPSIARIFGERSVRTQISSSGNTVKAKSSSASDTSVTIQIRGYIDTSKLIESFETITVTGTGYTTATSPKTFYEITQISKSADTVGYITIADGSDNILGYLIPEEYILRHKQLYLGADISDGEYDMELLYKRKIRRMVQDYDFPFIDCDNYLIYSGWGTALQEDKQFQMAEFILKRASQEMIRLVQNEAGQLGPEYQQKMESTFMQAHRG